MIDTTEKLEELIAKASRAPAVALDTEFVWERTFYPNLGLVQLAIERECYLIDPLMVEDLSSLGGLIANPAVVKVLHDAQQDLAHLKLATGASPLNVFDTRVGHGFCGGSSILSLAGMLMETVKVELPKTESRTNWVKRPLTPEQIEYARDDVMYLCEIMNRMLEVAKVNGTKDWMLDEMRSYDDPSLYQEIDPKDAYLKIKGHQRLKPRQLAVLRELAEWREFVARRLNRPRGHVVHNNGLLNLAYACPTKKSDIKASNNLPPKQIGKYGDVFVKCVKNAMELSEEELPQIATPRRDKNNMSQRIDQLAEAIEVKAKTFKLDPALLGSRKDLGTYICADGKASDEHRILRGWRAEFLKGLVLKDES